MTNGTSGSYSPEKPLTFTDPSIDSKVIHRIMVDGRVYMSVEDIVAVVERCAEMAPDGCDTACFSALAATLKMYR